MDSPHTTSRRDEGYQWRLRWWPSSKATDAVTGLHDRVTSYLDATTPERHFPAGGKNNCRRHPQKSADGAAVFRIRGISGASIIRVGRTFCSRLPAVPATRMGPRCGARVLQAWQPVKAVPRCVYRDHGKQQECSKRTMRIQFWCLPTKDGKRSDLTYPIKFLAKSSDGCVRKRAIAESNNCASRNRLTMLCCRAVVEG